MSGIDGKAVGDLHNCLQSQAALPAFNLPKLCPVNPASDRRCFLAEAECNAAVADPLAEGAGGLIESWLGLIVGHGVQPHTAHAEPTRARCTHVYCTHA